jgi:hypothetical protein
MMTVRETSPHVSVADPGSGAFLTPGSGSGIDFFWILDLGYGSVKQIFL